VAYRFKVGALEFDVRARIRDHVAYGSDVGSSLESDVRACFKLTPSGHTDLRLWHMNFTSRYVLTPCN